tara:strand:- start:146 stop:277 length:132 start_codon:yes stop_codon:yes gene_type:complete
MTVSAKGIEMIALASPSAERTLLRKHFWLSAAEAKLVEAPLLA